MRQSVRATDAVALRLVTGILPPGMTAVYGGPSEGTVYSVICRQDGTGGFRGHARIYRDREQMAVCETTEAAFDVLRADLRNRVIRDARNRVFVHAGAVTWRGSGIVIPGASNSGKTTLVRELVRLGAEYFSDEFAVLDQQGLLYPFAEPLSVREYPNGPQRPVRVHELGGTVGTQPATVRLILDTHFEAGATWRPRPLRQGRAALLLIANAIAGTRFPDRVTTAATAAVNGAWLLSGPRGDAATTARDIITWLDNREMPMGVARDVSSS